MSGELFLRHGEHELALLRHVRPLERRQDARDQSEARPLLGSPWGLVGDGLLEIEQEPPLLMMLLAQVSERAELQRETGEGQAREEDRLLPLVMKPVGVPPEERYEADRFVEVDRLTALELVHEDVERGRDGGDAGVLRPKQRKKVHATSIAHAGVFGARFFPPQMSRTCAVFCIGTELTRGELVDTNGPWLAAALTDLGFEVVEKITVDDDRKRIISALERVTRSSRIVVCTGGLGPTTDDLTTEAVAEALGVPTERDEASLEHIRRRLEKFGRTVSPTNAKQADFPRGAEVLANPIGTAPGFHVKVGESLAFFMPGVPREMKRMFEEQVVPRIRPLAPNDSCQIRLRTFGLPESVVGERLAGVEEGFPGVTIGYRAHFPEIEVKVLARGKAEALARELCDKATIEVRSRLADVVYGDGDDSFAGVVGRALRGRGYTLAIAESCTGGLVGHMVTREPGASDFLMVDAVTYANSAKTRFLGVDEDVLRGHGAVSAEVAAAMAEGVRRVSGADIALSLTGIAGPSGGSAEKPVGTVYLAIASPKGTLVKHRVFGGERLQVQTLAAYAGLQLVREACA